MMRWMVIWLGVLVALSGNVYAQKGLSRKARDLDEKASKAWEARDLNSAKTHYQQLVNLEPQWVPAHIRLGQIFEWEKQTELVQFHYKQAVELAPDSDEIIPALQWLAKDAQAREDYKTAANYWKSLLNRLEGRKSNSLQRLAKSQLESVEFALSALENPVPIERKQLSDTVNRMQLQFFPVLTADQVIIIFTRLNEG